jgi:TRAP-type C4-dicarboxylate transport system permease small subunit
MINTPTPAHAAPAHKNALRFCARAALRFCARAACCIHSFFMISSAFVVVHLSSGQSYVVAKISFFIFSLHFIFFSVFYPDANS